MNLTTIGVIIYAVIAMVIIAIILAYAVICAIARKSVKSEYTAPLDNNQQLVIKQLVEEVAPKVKHSDYTQKTISSMLTHNEAFGPERYFYFKNRLAKNTLSVKGLTNDMSGYSGNDV